MKNRIIYDAKRNETYWFDKDGEVQKQDDVHPNFSVKVGNSVAFEIINVNPEAYSLSIKDTSVSIFQDANDMLARYLTPFSNPDIVAAGTNPDGKAPEDPATKRIYQVRAAIITIDAALNDFASNQIYACENLHFKLIDNKIEARKRVDQFLEGAPLNKPKGKSLDQFMRDELNITKEDSTIYKVTIQLYKTLPASYYHMEYSTKTYGGKDRIDFTYSIIAKPNTPYMDKARGEIASIYIIGGFKVDVSTGLYYAPWLRNDVYTLRSDSDMVANGTVLDTIRGKRLIDDRNFGEFGFVSYLHFYKKECPGFGWGGHIGVGLSLNDQIKPRYFFGLS
ncbi:MAG: hypothetical protein EOP48_34285, partial [Sphingobacteriales bacterium]